MTDTPSLLWMVRDETVVLLNSPAYSPELNPIGQVWSWLRQHHLINRSFKDYDNIIDEVCYAWNGFVSDSKRVINMCTRDRMNLNS